MQLITEVLLQLYISLEIKLTKILKILKFKQSDWLKIHQSLQ